MSVLWFGGCQRVWAGVFCLPPDATRGRRRSREGIVVLSPARTIPREKPRGPNLEETGPPGAVRRPLTQKRKLETELKVRRGTGAARKDRPQMLHGLQQGMNLTAGGRGLLPAQPGPHLIQPAHASAAATDRRFPTAKGSRKVSTAAVTERPASNSSSHRHTSEAVRVCRGKTSASRTEKVLPQPPRWPRLEQNTRCPATLAVGFGIIAAPNTVPVQRAQAAAVGTALLLEGKSCVFNSCSSRTK